MSAEDAITKKIGPLPAWAWAGSVVLLVLAFRYWQNRNADAVPVADRGTDLTAPANDPAVADPFGGGGFTGDGSGSGGFGDGSGDGTNTDLADTLGGILDGIT